MKRKRWAMTYTDLYRIKILSMYTGIYIQIQNHHTHTRGDRNALTLYSSHQDCSLHSRTQAFYPFTM
eukprot:9511941-Ditylum_brightwellii.AAC.1